MITLAAVFVLAGAAEVLWPLHPPSTLTRLRWIGNLALLALTAGLVALMPWVDPAHAVTTAVVPWAWPSTGAAGWLALVLGVLVLDLLGYVAHRLFHAVPPLWRPPPRLQHAPGHPHPPPP